MAEARGDSDFDQYNGWKVTGFSVVGMPEGMGGEVQRGMAQAGRWRLLGGLQRPPFTSRQLAEDLARLRLYLAQRGYPAAGVTPVVTPEPYKRQLKLVLQVQPGEPVRLGGIELHNWPEGVPLPGAEGEEALREGAILEDLKVLEGLANLYERLLDAGYAEVTIRHELVPDGPHSVKLVVDVRPGDFYRIDEVEITGASEDLMGVSRRVMNVKPGSDFSQEMLANASLDLRTTQLYRSVVLETEPIGPGSLRLKAHLENGRMRTWDASIGTWSDNPWMIRAGWTHRNLFKHGVGFDLRGVVASHRLGASTGVSWLGWLSPRARTRTGLGFLVEDEDAYYSEEASIEIVQSFRPRDRDLFNFGLTLSNTQVEETGKEARDIPETQGKLFEIWSDRKWDRSDDPLFPKHGGYLKIRGTYAPPWLISDVPYVSAQLDLTKYFGIKETIVLAGRGRVGWGEPLGGNPEIIATRRFYAGGYNTHRGYGRRKLGPKDADGNARGGEFVVLGGAEVRAPFIWKFDLAAFIDAGNLWAKPSEFHYSDIPVAIGLDLDFRSPLGPLRVGYAHNIASLIEGEPRDLWHFGIGYPW
jgi:outer membrane protein assembly factor BamA